MRLCVPRAGPGIYLRPPWHVELSGQGFLSIFQFAFLNELGVGCPPRAVIVFAIPRMSRAQPVC